jgi:hypothetical protein
MEGIEPDAVFAEVKPADAVTFNGWLESAGKNKFYLYTDRTLNLRYEITSDQIVHQIPGSQRPDGSSIVWVSSKAKIVRGEVGLAEDFAVKFDETFRRPPPKY